MIILHDKTEIEAFLRKNVYLHIYSLGDLDDFFWNYTTWYASKENGQINAVILLYTGLPLPTLLALSDEVHPLKNLLRSMRHLLPRRFYAHLSPGLEEVITAEFQLKPYGRHYKMALRHPLKLKNVDTPNVVRLAKADLADISGLFQVSYPENWFDPRMLETNQYFGYRRNGQLLSIAGVHVYSTAYKVAALGNITTHPHYRGQGLGRAVTAKLCQSLAETVDYIGLNVNSDNQAAVTLYQKLGFEVAGVYHEHLVEAK